ncbi:D-alanyl-D-alanine carboxypeptidase family protein [Rhodanobacter sp. C03]|uniref:D-alanyl-D-alanine carboxypeptidase family protein n=1 Tax=Rhodanobacter sp. C03 TaxID=1945858 RepID=UPI0009D0705E|nr:D-alanyl-D-alanine carboxypeptidase family protein [Rhodanobacter sp. C03]OOG59790.1 D-alanyl-D-alanine carboxypeptidase [Rhodanobacter sp. C03]
MFAAALLAGLSSFMGVAHAGYAAIVVNPATGQVLSAVNADEQNHPASLTKMMTLYLTFQALQNGKLQIDQLLPVSAWAAAKAPTKLGLRAGQTISVRDCILGMITKSANDAATVMAEGLGGSEDHFVEMMNAQALRIGMTDTRFGNASGLPDPDDATTTRDMAKLAIALYHDFPQDTPYFATKEFVFRGRLVRGHNHLMDRYPGMDGLKTGFTDASGFNLASTAVRDGQRLFAVVMGGRTAAVRDNLMARLLDDGFDHRQTPAILVAEAGSTHSSMAHRVLAALSPIGSAEAEAVPVPQHHHRRGKRDPVARNICTRHRGVTCPRRNLAAHPRRSATRLAHRNTKRSVIMASSHRNS